MHPDGIDKDVITFQEFLHSDNWKKPLLPDLNKATRKIAQRGQQAKVSTTTIPAHQKLMMALGRAGARGLARSEISGLVNLDGKTLEDLLAALVRGGEIGVFQVNGQRVYRRLV